MRVLEMHCNDLLRWNRNRTRRFRYGAKRGSKKYCPDNTELLQTAQAGRKSSLCARRKASTSRPSQSLSPRSQTMSLLRARDRA